MQLFGVINANPDSLHESSMVNGQQEALDRARWLLNGGADGIDLGAQGSTGIAAVVEPEVEWGRIEAIVPAIAALGVPFSVDTWRPAVARLALEAGANVINAADGMQTDEMWQVAADYDVPIVVPFLSGPDPLRMSLVQRDPVETIVEFFDARLADADRFGVRARCVIDPGTGFAPADWPWAERYLYQKQVYSNLDALRRWDLPLYIALPWKDTEQHDELLEIVLRHQPEFGRVHDPVKVRTVERRLRP